MNSVNKTLYIPLYGKSYVSKKGLFLDDKYAEKIWENEGFDLKGKSKSKWLAYYMGIRSAVFDEWVKQKLAEKPSAVVIHIGCGMDSRVIRVGKTKSRWYDVDFPEVIDERKKYYSDSPSYKMIGADARDSAWLGSIAENTEAIVVIEGVSMYMSVKQMQALLGNLCSHFDSICLLMDAYTTFAAKMSKKRNPINDVGVTEVYGVDNPKEYQTDTLIFLNEHSMTPQRYIDELKGLEKRIFAKLYAGDFSKKLYRLFEYEKE